MVSSLCRPPMPYHYMWARLASLKLSHLKLNERTARLNGMQTILCSLFHGEREFRCPETDGAAKTQFIQLLLKRIDFLTTITLTDSCQLRSAR